MKITKRDGRIVEFDENKIRVAIEKANETVAPEERLTNLQIYSIVQGIVYKCSKEQDNITVEKVQDMVECAIVQYKNYQVAKSYITYRYKHNISRDMSSNLMKVYRDLTFMDAKDNNIKRENANIDTDSAMGTMLKYGSEGSKQFYTTMLIDPKYADAHRNGDIHIHDLDFYALTLTCCQIDLTKLFKDGFSTGHGFLREPNSITSYSALACIAIQSNQNDMHGGQSVPSFDHDMVPGVKKSYKKSYFDNFKKYLDSQGYDNLADHVKDLENRLDDKNLPWPAMNMNNGRFHQIEKDFWNSFISESVYESAKKFARKYADIEIDKMTYQAMEALIHNLNTMHCLPGSERIWVFNTHNGLTELISMKDLTESFVCGKYFAYSMNMKTGECELKQILAAQRKDNNRDLVTLTDNCGKRVTVTTNHKVLTVDRNTGEFYKDIPENITQMLSPTAKPENLKQPESDLTVFVTDIVNREFSNSGEEYVYDISVADNENFMTEDMIYVSNSRAGAQVPFSSLNYGTDTTPEGRLVIKNLLLAEDAGMGNGETPIFPIQIFKVKEGINYNPEDPNYDLFKLAMKVSAKRLFPNFSFLDAPFNIPFYVPGKFETEVTYMGCRTRVMANVYDPDKQIANGRGNLSFTSINLPRLAIKANGDIDKFYSMLDETMDLVIGQLTERFKIQCRKKVRNFPFLMGNGIWIDSDKLDIDDTVEEIIKHGTLSMGFIGLAECLTALIGKHHGESEEAQKLGLEIVGRIRKRCDDESAKTKLNYTCLATPAEGLSGRFVKMDKALYGEIPGVTDKDYYTNSFHIPVKYNISAFDKIRLEAPYHALTNAGHISYIELDGDPLKNLDAFEAIIRFMKESGIGYGSINHPVDRDPVCGYTGIIDEVCPRCGRRDGEGISIEKLQKLGLYKHINASSCGYCGDEHEEEDRNELPNTI